jgi:hypothetical protein
MFDDDLATMYADPVLSDSARIGAVSTSGFFDAEDVLEPDPAGGFTPINRRTFTFELGSVKGRAFDAVAVFDADIVIKGTTYRVRDSRHVGEHQKKVILA